MPPYPPNQSSHHPVSFTSLLLCLPFLPADELLPCTDLTVAMVENGTCGIVVLVGLVVIAPFDDDACVLLAASYWVVTVDVSRNGVLVLLVSCIVENDACVVLGCGTPVWKETKLLHYHLSLKLKLSDKAVTSSTISMFFIHLSNMKKATLHKYVH